MSERRPGIDPDAELGDADRDDADTATEREPEQQIPPDAPSRGVLDDDGDDAPEPSEPA